MPRVAIPVTQITRAGVAAPAETTGDPVNHHSVANNGRVILLARNSGATVDRTITLHLTPIHDGQTVTPRTVTIPQSESRYIGPFDTGDYGASLQVDVDNAELMLTALRI